VDRSRFYSGQTLDEFTRGMIDEDRVAFASAVEAVRDLVRRTSIPIPACLEANIYAAAEAWCADTKVNLPVVVVLAELSPGIEVRCHTRDSSRDLGVERIPALIVYDHDFKEKGRWIERPQRVKDAMGRAATREEKLLTWSPYVAGAFREETLAELLRLVGGHDLV
jgi:hypothetical protein